MGNGVWPLTGTLSPSRDGTAPARTNVTEQTLAGDVTCELTLENVRLVDALSSLCVSKQANGDSNIFTRKDALVFIVRQIPYLCKHAWRKLRAAEYLHCGFACDYSKFLCPCLLEYLVDEGYLLRRRGEFRHGLGERARLRSWFVAKSSERRHSRLSNCVARARLGAFFPRRNRKQALCNVIARLPREPRPKNKIQTPCTSTSLHFVHDLLQRHLSRLHHSPHPRIL